MTTVAWIKHLKIHGQGSTYPGRLWQRNYYEHVIRSEFELEQTRAYIHNNPIKKDLQRDGLA